MARLIIKKRHRGWVGAVAWSPDGQRIVSACQDQQVQVWEVATGKTRVTHPLGSAGVVWFPDGARIATRGSRMIAIWEARTGKTLLTYTGHTEHVTALALSPDGARIASGG